MTLVKRTNDIMRDTLDPFKVFDDIFDGGMFRPLRTTWSQVDDIYHVETNDNGMKLSVDVPGVKAADMDISIQGREIRISGKQRGREFAYRYVIARTYDIDGARASLADGVLTLEFDKVPEAQPKKIEINVVK